MVTARDMRYTRVKDYTPEMNETQVRAMRGANTRVDVAFNLRRKEYSIRAFGKVQAYATKVTLSIASFRVSERGRQKVLVSGNKNVHAFVEGYMTLVDPEKYLGDDAGVPVRYNPFEAGYFQTLDGRRVLRCTYITLEVVDGRYQATGYNVVTEDVNEFTDSTINGSTIETTVSNQEVK